MMQRIKSLPRRCYSSCKGTIIKLKTRKDDKGIDITFLSIACVFVVLILREWSLDPIRSVPIYFCQDHCSAEEVDGVYKYNVTHLKCQQVCVLQLNRETPPQSDCCLQFQDQYPIDSLPTRLLLCIIAIILIFGHNIKKNMNTQICLTSPQGVTWQMVLFRQLPLKTVTKVLGRLFSCQFPYPLNIAIVTCFAFITKINIDEAEDDNLSNYDTILKLFTRKLKEGIRPVNDMHTMVVPADSRVIYVGGVVNNTLEQIKGVKYSLKTFLGRGVVPVCKEGHSLFSAVFYLAPGYYHHFHSPVEWTVDLCRHFEGELITVSPWAVKCMPGLFALNERVLLSGQWKHGFFSMTAVGALNVGTIHVKVCKDLVMGKDNEDYRYTPYTSRRLSPTDLSKGEYVGGFTLGSTVVLVFEAPIDFKFIVEDGYIVKYGEALGTV